MERFNKFDSKFDHLLGRQFKYKGILGLSDWTDTIKELIPISESITGLQYFRVKSEKGIVYFSCEIEIV